MASKSLGITQDYKIDYEGIENFIKHQFDNTDAAGIKRWAHGFMDEKKCSVCEGARLNKESLNFKIDELDIADVSALDLGDLKIGLKTYLINYLLMSLQLLIRS